MGKFDEQLGQRASAPRAPFKSNDAHDTKALFRAFPLAWVCAVDGAEASLARSADRAAPAIEADRDAILAELMQPALRDER